MYTPSKSFLRKIKYSTIQYCLHPFLVYMEGSRCAGVAHPLLLLRGEDGRLATRPFHPSGEEERLPCHRYQGGLKLLYKLFHRMINRSCKFQGCSSIYTGMVKDLDVPVLSVTVGISIGLCGASLELKWMCIV